METLHPSDFERVGGEQGLRRIIEDFTARVFGDVMIGFLFKGKPHKRITEMEYRFAAEHLGGPVAYTGRELGEAHKSSPILGGHFQRRRQILLGTLVDRAVPDDVVARWLAEVDRHRDTILGRGGDAVGCDHAAQAKRALSARAPKNLLGPK